MDKQKRIEEIEQFLARKILGGKAWNTRDIAEGVYELIAENAVVLTQEEWATVHEQFAQAMYQKEVNTRKETAEKFAEKAIDAFFGVNCIDMDEWDWYQNRLGEICKEITEGKV